MDVSAWMPHRSVRAKETELTNGGGQPPPSTNNESNNMSDTTNIGIDWGNGVTNIDPTNNIRYGVISMHSLSPEWDQWQAEPDYGEPHCPKCGNPATTQEDFDYSEENKNIYLCEDCNKVWVQEDIKSIGHGGPALCECGGHCEQVTFEHEYGCLDHACHQCLCTFDSDQAYPDEPVGYTAKDERYKVETCLVSDLIVTKSPYYTRAQLCSPCVPGACNLDTPTIHGQKCYALGHEWFEEKAPYPVFKVDNDMPVEP
jgi:hypothetical protein